jgi:protein-disulfide isomerase
MENNKQTQQIAGAIIIAGIIIAGAVLLRGNEEPLRRQPTPDQIVQQATEDSSIRAISFEEHIWGNINAEIFIVEYSDTECPFCKVFHSTMHTAITQNNGKVAWVYRHFPIPELHTKAIREAEATECAWEQGGNDMFWKYIDEIFTRTQSNDRLDSAELPKIAGELGLNVVSFNRCLDSGKYASKVQVDMDDGKRAGVRGTPSSFIMKNDKVVDTIAGAQPLEVVNRKIEEALK